MIAFKGARIVFLLNLDLIDLLPIFAVLLDPPVCYIVKRFFRVQLSENCNLINILYWETLWLCFFSIIKNNATSSIVFTCCKKSVLLIDISSTLESAETHVTVIYLFSWRSNWCKKVCAQIQTNISLDSSLPTLWRQKPQTYSEFFQNFHPLAKELNVL